MCFITRFANLPKCTGFATYHGDVCLRLYTLDGISRRAMTITSPKYVELHVVRRFVDDSSSIYFAALPRRAYLPCSWVIDSVRFVKHYMDSGLWDCGFLPPSMAPHGFLRRGVNDNPSCIWYRSDRNPYFHLFHPWWVPVVITICNCIMQLIRWGATFGKSFTRHLFGCFQYTILTDCPKHFPILRDLSIIIRHLDLNCMNYLLNLFDIAINSKFFSWFMQCMLQSFQTMMMPMFVRCRKITLAW